jgi:hypothetical protein
VPGLAREGEDVLDHAEQQWIDELGIELLGDLADHCIGGPLTDLDVTAQHTVEVRRVLGRVPATPDGVQRAGGIE